MANTITQLLERTNRDGLKAVQRKLCEVGDHQSNRDEIIKCFDPRVPFVGENETPTVWCCDDCFDEYLLV